jgi:hypothetical protein
MIGEGHPVADRHRYRMAQPGFDEAIVKKENADYCAPMRRRARGGGPGARDH